MNRTPKRLTISDEQAEKIRKKYGYSKLYAFSPSFLEEYKDEILRHFSDEEQRKNISNNMSNIKAFIIGDRLRVGLSRLCCSRDTIHMDISFADIVGDSFSLKKGCEYIETIFVHELLHAASRQNMLSGIETIDTVTLRKKNVGLNEGITQFLAEQVTKQKVPDEIDSYAYGKHVVELLVDVLGQHDIEDSYFNHTSALKNKINTLSQDANYFEELSKQLDTINRLDVAIRRIKRGAITPQNPDSLTRMEAVVNAERETVMESLFVRIVLPQIQTIDDKSERQQRLLSLLLNHEDILRPVAKYISKHPHSDWVSDEVLASIKKEILEDGMNFEKIMEAARNIDACSAIGPEIAKDFIGVVDNFYAEHQNKIVNDRAITLTPLLKKQLSNMVIILEKLELNATREQDYQIKTKLQESLDNYMVFLKKYFHMVPNLEEEIDKIRQEKSVGDNRDIHAESILEMAKKAGERQGKVDSQTAGTSVKSITDDGKSQSLDDEHDQKREEDSKKVRYFTIEDDYIINDITGAVTCQKNLSIYERVKNIVAASGEFSSEDDPKIKAMRSSSAKEYTESVAKTLQSKDVQKLKKIYGDSWQEKIQQAYEEGYRLGMQTALANAQKEGLTVRKEIAEKVKNGTVVSERKEFITLDEVKFVYENFDVKTKDTGEVEVVDKLNDGIVMSERTKKITVFAQEWVKITGDQAFTPASSQIYRFIQSQVCNNLREKGTIDLSGLATDVDIMGLRYKTVTQALITKDSLIDSYFRMQIPNALVNSEREVTTKRENVSYHGK